MKAHLVTSEIALVVVVAAVAVDATGVAVAVAVAGMAHVSTAVLSFSHSRGSSFPPGLHQLAVEKIPGESVSSA